MAGVSPTTRDICGEAGVRGGLAWPEWAACRGVPGDVDDEHDPYEEEGVEDVVEPEPLWRGRMESSLVREEKGAWLGCGVVLAGDLLDHVRVSVFNSWSGIGTPDDDSVVLSEDDDDIPTTLTPPTVTQRV